MAPAARARATSARVAAAGRMCNDDAAYYQKRVADLTVKVATATSTESRQWAEKQLEGATAMLAQREQEAGAAGAGREDEGTDAEVSATAGNNWR